MRGVVQNHSTESDGDVWASALRSPSGSASRLRPLNSQETENIAPFTQEQQQQILSTREMVAIVARFICKKYTVPVQIGASGGGWYWNPEEQAVILDPKELLANPLEFSRFVMGHEGTHALITEVSLIDENLKRDSSFWFLWNRMEDPRVNNYLVEAYPEMREDMQVAYEISREKTLREQQRAISEQGFYPRAAQAVDFLTQHWLEISPDSDQAWINHALVDPEVLRFIEEVKESAQSAYNLYPSAEEVFDEEGRQVVARYCRASYKIITEQIWPKFQKLAQADHLDAVTSEVLQALVLKSSNPENHDNQIEVLLDAVSPNTRETIKEIARSLIDKQLGLSNAIIAVPEPIKQELADKLGELKEQLKEMHEAALKILRDLFERLSQEIPLRIPPLGEPETSEGEDNQGADKKEDKFPDPDTEGDAGSSEIAEVLEALKNKHKNQFESVRAEVKDTIDTLTRELRGVLRERRASHYKSGLKEGPLFDAERRSQEVAKGVPAHDSRAYMKKIAAKVHAEAIMILVDLSGSMQGEKIRETFKAVVVLSEALNRLQVPFEVLGFNDRIHELKSFKEKLSSSAHKRLSAILGEVTSDRGRYNDDGWALLEAQKRLLIQKQERKFLLVISDGEPAPSSAHQHIELEDAVAEVLKSGDINLIGLGLGEGTEHVKTYYPEALANISAKDLRGSFSRLISEILRGKR